MRAVVLDAVPAPPDAPVAQAVPFRSELPWTTLGAVPEMLQTAYGALTVGPTCSPVRRC